MDLVLWIFFLEISWYNIFLQIVSFVFFKYIRIIE